MNNDVIYEITKRELSVLEEFMGALKEERDAIVSFSLEGITQQNNRKEDILRRLEYLESEREGLFEAMEDPQALRGERGYEVLSQRMHGVLKEVMRSMEHNKRLLSFSMDHVRTSIETIVSNINATTYGRKAERLSVMLSKEA